MMNETTEIFLFFFPVYDMSYADHSRKIEILTIMSIIQLEMFRATEDNSHYNDASHMRFCLFIFLILSLCPLQIMNI